MGKVATMPADRKIGPDWLETLNGASRTGNTMKNKRSKLKVRGSDQALIDAQNEKIVQLLRQTTPDPSYKSDPIELAESLASIEKLMRDVAD